MSLALEQHFTAEPLSPVLGASIVGLDLREPLPGAEKTALDGVRVVHSWEISRARAGAKATPEEIADAPPMTHPLVRTIPETGRKALFMGEHAAYFEGQPEEVGRVRLEKLVGHAAQERFVYRLRGTAPT